MTEHSIVLLISIAFVAAAAILIYATSRIYALFRVSVFGCGQIAHVNAAFELRQAIDQILANSQQTERSLRDQRRVPNDAH